MESVIIYLINTFIGACVGWAVKKINESQAEREQIKRDNEILKQGFQAMLRSQMISEYKQALDKGFAPIWAKDNFENLYAAYHKCGANGVMTDIHGKYMALPTEEK